MNAAIIEFDPLTNSIGAAPQDHDLLAVRGFRFAKGLVGRVHVGGCRSEFGRTAINPLINWPNIKRQPLLSN